MTAMPNGSSSCRICCSCTFALGTLVCCFFENQRQKRKQQQQQQQQQREPTTANNKNEERRRKNQKRKTTTITHTHTHTHTHSHTHTVTHTQSHTLHTLHRHTQITQTQSTPNIHHRSEPCEHALNTRQTYAPPPHTPPPRTYTRNRIRGRWAVFWTLIYATFCFSLPRFSSKFVMCLKMHFE